MVRLPVPLPEPFDELNPIFGRGGVVGQITAFVVSTKVESYEDGPDETTFGISTSLLGDFRMRLMSDLISERSFSIEGLVTSLNVEKAGYHKEIPEDFITAYQVSGPFREWVQVRYGVGNDKIIEVADPVLFVRLVETAWVWDTVNVSEDLVTYVEESPPFEDEPPEHPVLLWWCNPDQY
tara:strand:+ start:6309 stop:6848 length:540 start_codon:yes stop_codon:yes gene_type:complete